MLEVTVPAAREMLSPTCEVAKAMLAQWHKALATTPGKSETSDP